MASERPPCQDVGATAVLEARPREVAFSRFHVQVQLGPDQGASQVADAPELVIGSARGNQLVLTDQAVSRHHCVITVTPQGFLLRDLGSTNGTRVSGIRVEAAYLDPGALIGVGQSTLRFDVLPDEIREPLGDEDLSGRVLGQSTAMRRIFAMLPRVAASDSTVLLEGETGTGKGLFAELIHQQSRRASGPFVVIDCGAIPPTLIESELFGHAKGAFTGAQQARAGAFEAARGGTVLLDELGELRLDLQPKLLRALEERTIRRVGSLDPIRLDVRVIAATNRDLRQEVNRGNFRSDLFYRLNVVRIRVPSLRERREDIPLLVAHFYRQFADGANPPLGLVEAMARHDWPGNVRELRGAVERAVLLGDPVLWREGAATEGEAAQGEARENVFREDDLSLSFREAKERVITLWERAYVHALIRANGSNVSRAARAARMDRNYLRELLRRHGVLATDA
ncbi:sigma 54-interacting transcriptional regulator [Sorangium sp. So ce367]|uniref:sigma 54-interacting transcriptional regulator n=1 Tax=Sorangium sp. So ce367 TaxID=3133305 RepID=UPI003F638C25